MNRTEMRNPASMHLDEMSTLEMVKLINSEYGKTEAWLVVAKRPNANRYPMQTSSTATMPAGPNARCAPPRNADTMPPPTIAITISAVISFVFSGTLSMASPMHMPKEFAVMSATMKMQTKNAVAVPTNGIAAVARMPTPMHHGKHFAAETFANTIAPRNAAIVLATK